MTTLKLPKGLKELKALRSLIDRKIKKLEKPEPKGEPYYYFLRKYPIKDDLKKVQGYLKKNGYDIGDARLNSFLTRTKINA